MYSIYRFPHIDGMNKNKNLIVIKWKCKEIKKQRFKSSVVCVAKLCDVLSSNKILFYLELLCVFSLSDI
jgi:hypothetical protein